MARVLHLISSNQRRGAETFAVELAEALVPLGHDVDVLAIRPSLVGPHVEVRVAGRSRLDPVGFVRVLRAARRSDIVVGFGSISLQTGALVSALARRPFVYRNIGDPAAWQNVRASGVRVGWPLRRATAVVAVFPEAGDELTRRYRIPTERIRAIPRGVPEDRFAPTDDAGRARARARLGLDPDRPWVAFIGSLSAEKDPLLAVRAVAATAAAGLLICGDGPLAPLVQDEVAGSRDRFALTGPVDDVREVLAASDVLLLTSHTEGVPGVAIEAGLSGIPVVAPAVGGIAGVVRHDRTGFVVDDRHAASFAAGIEAAIERRDELGGRAREHCRRHFSMSAVAGRWDELLREQLGRPRSG